MLWVRWGTKQREYQWLLGCKTVKIWSHFLDEGEEEARKREGEGKGEGSFLLAQVTHVWVSETTPSPSLYCWMYSVRSR